VVDCPAVGQVGADLGAATILVVEDEVLIRMMLAEELRDAGYAVLEAANTDEALALLMASPAIALVFTDVRMPGTVDGLGLARWVREQRPHLKVVVASADQASLRGPAEWDLVMTKPYDIAGMLLSVRRLLGGILER